MINQCLQPWISATPVIAALLTIFAGFITISISHFLGLRAIQKSQAWQATINRDQIKLSDEKLRRATAAAILGQFLSLINDITAFNSTRIEIRASSSENDAKLLLPLLPKTLFDVYKSYLPMLHMMGPMLVVDIIDVIEISTKMYDPEPLQALSYEKAAFHLINTQSISTTWIEHAQDIARRLNDISNGHDDPGRSTNLPTA